MHEKNIEKENFWSEKNRDRQYIEREMDNKESVSHLQCKTYNWNSL